MRQPPKVAWQIKPNFPTGFTDAVGSVVLVFSDASNAHDAKLAGYDLTTGALLWSLSNDPIDLGDISDKVVALNVMSGSAGARSIEALDVRTGHALWTRNDSAVSGDLPPTVDTQTGSLILFGRTDPATVSARTVTVLDGIRGTVRWQRSGLWSVSYDPNLLYDQDATGLTAVDIGDGKTLAMTTLAPDVVLYHIPGKPALVVAAPTRGSGPAQAYTALTLRPVWRHPLPPKLAVILGSTSRLFVMQRDSDTVTAYDAATGHQAWTYRPANKPVNGIDQHVIDGQIVFVQQDLSLTRETFDALDSQTGARQWSITLPAYGAAVAGSNGVTYLFTQDDPPGASWTVTAVDATSGAKLWDRIAQHDRFAGDQSLLHQHPTCIASRPASRLRLRAGTSDPVAPVRPPLGAGGSGSGPSTTAVGPVCDPTQGRRAGGERYSRGFA